MTCFGFYKSLYEYIAGKNQQKTLTKCASVAAFSTVNSKEKYIVVLFCR